ncbi:MAG: hypothetical protein L6R40_008712 [Gallowayella cf. fulva]|nr:MAG: hypothetical protein L6R40_008712 [Xanthomendoza cf. fulva]
MQAAYSPGAITAAAPGNMRDILFENLVGAVNIAMETMIAKTALRTDKTELRKIAVAFIELYRVCHELPLPVWHFSCDADKLTFLIEEMWVDEIFQHAIERGNGYDQYDNVEYFFHHRKRLFQSIDWNKADDLQGRAGFFRWVDCLFFVASLAGYHKFIGEGVDANQLQESLLFFQSILASRGSLNCTNSSIVLILNEVDVFKRDIKKRALKTYFPDFVGKEKDCEAALIYITAKFKSMQPLDDNREIRIYYTATTDIKGFENTLLQIEDQVTSHREHGGDIIGLAL